MQRDDITTESIRLANTVDLEPLVKRDELSDVVRQDGLATVATTGDYNDLRNVPEYPQRVKHFPTGLPEKDSVHTLNLETAYQVYDITLTGTIERLTVTLPQSLDADHVYNAELWLRVAEAEIEDNELLDDSKWTWVGQKPSFNNQTDRRYFISLRAWGSGNDGQSGIRLISCWRCDEL